MEKWISVNDRLPVLNEIVLGFATDDVIDVWDFCEVTSKGFKMMAKVNKKLQITHWMPLPNKPN